jgi:hypothetical protein
LKRASRPPLGRAHNRKDKIMKTSNTKSRPTHRIYAVTKNGDSKFWQPIGAMWAHADDKGFNLRIDYLPLNEAEIVVRVAGDKQAEAGGVAQ